MEAIVRIVFAVIRIVGINLIRKNAKRHEYEQYAAANPLDADLVEVYKRPAASAGWEAGKAADTALREATGHIRYRTHEQGQTPLLIVHSGTGYDPSAANGLLVVTTAETLLFSGGRMQAVSHGEHPTTRILTMPGGQNPAVLIEGEARPINVACPDLEQARLICTVIDLWVGNPEVIHDARVHVTPHRVEIPDVFFADILRAVGHPVTPFNMRSIHERIGSLITHKARTMIDQDLGLAEGERFSTRHGRPTDDCDLPGWAAHSLQGWIALQPDIGYTAGPYLPAHFRRFLLDTAARGGYLSTPSRPLQMWMSDQYENDGSGPRRPHQPGQPPISA